MSFSFHEITIWQVYRLRLGLFQSSKSRKSKTSRSLSLLRYRTGTFTYLRSGQTLTCSIFLVHTRLKAYPYPLSLLSALSIVSKLPPSENKYGHGTSPFSNMRFTFQTACFFHCHVHFQGVSRGLPLPSTGMMFVQIFIFAPAETC